MCAMNANRLYFGQPIEEIGNKIATNQKSASLVYNQET